VNAAGLAFGAAPLNQFSESDTMRLIERPGTIHDQFCRCRACKPAGPISAAAAGETRIAILCMLAITVATCSVVLH
jgi:hypothetical protein